MPFRTWEPNPRTFVQTSNLFCVNSAVVAGDRETLLVDPAWFADELATLRARAATSPAGRATRLAVTHCDGDHIGQWKQFADLRIIAAPGEQELDWAMTGRWKDWIDDLLMIPGSEPFGSPATDHYTWLETLDLGGLTARFVPVRGHTMNSQFIIIPELHLLLCGDFLSNLMLPLVRTSFADYLAALARLRELCAEYAITCLVPGHGDLLADTAAITRQIDDDSRYVTDVATAVTQARKDGATVDEAMKRCADLLYRGHSAGNLPGGVHGANIKMAYERRDESLA